MIMSSAIAALGAHGKMASFLTGISLSALVPISYVVFSGWVRRADRRTIEVKQCGSRRLNLDLSTTVYRELSILATERRSSMTDVVRFALGLVKIAFQETAAGNKLIVTTADGKPVKEIMMPDQL
jgi:hypothetical protein